MPLANPGDIAFQSSRDGNQEIYVVNVETGVETRLTHTEELDELAPAWSQDGAELAFAVRQQAPWLSRIDVLRSADDRVTLPSEPALVYSSPAWSPDGSELAFTGRPSGSNRSHIYKMAADGSPPERLTPFEVSASAPSWSPEGDRIAFTRHGQIWTMESDGSRQLSLTLTRGSNWGPAWSPDGTRIAFAGRRDPGPPQVFVTNADRRSELRLIAETGSNPSWSPDGESIVFDDSGRGLFIVNADGTGRTQLVDDPAASRPAWSPLP